MSGPSTYRICSRCVMDTSDREIIFDEAGVCNNCHRAEMLLKTRLPAYKTGEYGLSQIIPKIQRSRPRGPYDCVVGVSGGCDSTYVAYLTKKHGLRPLAVHFDNGWNSELAVHNIEHVLRKLGIDLHTYVVDWPEFRDLQLAFLRASVPDAEIPTDHAIWALLFRTAARFGVKYIISGTNLSTESILPRSWTYYVTDWTYIKSIQRAHGTRPLRSYPRCSLAEFMYYVLVRRIRTVSLLNAVNYDKKEAMELLQREIGWRDYGGKHHESIYTRFFQSYILPTKFGIDKRRAHLSSMIMSGQIDREAALRELQEPIADPEQVREDLDYVAKKLDVGRAEFDRIMTLPVKSFADYKTDFQLYERIKRLMRVAQDLHLLPRQVGM